MQKSDNKSKKSPDRVGRGDRSEDKDADRKNKKVSQILILSG